MSTALDLIKDAMMDLGVLQDGEAPTAGEQNYAFRQLNLMLDSWSTESLSVFCKTTVSFNLVAAQAVYPLGVGGTLDVNGNAIARPEYLTHAWVNINGQDQPVTIIDQNQWDLEPLKQLSGSFPTKVFYDPQYPLGQLKPWPVSQTAYPFWIEFMQVLAQFAGINTTVSFPPGYESAVQKNLACRLPGFRVQPTADLVATARETKANIERINGLIHTTKMRNDFPSRRSGGRVLSPFTNRPIGGGN